VRCSTILAVLVLAAAPLRAQTPVEQAAAADPATERGQIAKNCPSHIVGCVQVLFTGDPLHIAVGSLSPQNGFAAGLAYVGHDDRTSGNWRNSWSGDAVISGNLSWRAGFYMKFVHSHIEQAGVGFGTTGASASNEGEREHSVYSVYAQAISVNKLTMFGLGSSSLETGRSFFGMTETIVGASTVHPLTRSPLNLAVYTEMNGRIVNPRPGPDGATPSIEQIYGPSDAPGLDDQTAFVQLGVGARVRPSFANNLVQLNYDVAYRPFLDASGHNLSFQRLTIDLDHQYSIYRTVMRVKGETNTPNDCTSRDSGGERLACRPIASTSKEGTIGFRLFSSMAATSGGNAVPFYFQPTMGGSDINGDKVLSAYQDYRFRAANVVLLRESVEHSLGKWPVGLMFLADQGKVANATGDLGTARWLQSYAAGLTVRAGGLPVIAFLFAFGGREGTHTVINMSDSLLGSGGRPSLF
jgi:hypothetical protein